MKNYVVERYGFIEDQEYSFYDNVTALLFVLDETGKKYHRTRVYCSNDAVAEHVIDEWITGRNYASGEYVEV